VNAGARVVKEGGVRGEQGRPRGRALIAQHRSVTSCARPAHASSPLRAIGNQSEGCLRSARRCASSSAVLVLLFSALAAACLLLLLLLRPPPLLLASRAPDPPADDDEDAAEVVW